MSARTPQEIERGFATMPAERIDAVIILLDGLMFQQRVLIAGLALKHRLPSIYPQPQYAKAGGLMSYGADTVDNFRRAGVFVDKILRGAKPGELPFEQPRAVLPGDQRQDSESTGHQTQQRTAGARRRDYRLRPRTSAFRIGPLEVGCPSALSESGWWLPANREPASAEAPMIP